MDFVKKYYLMYPTLYVSLGFVDSDITQVELPKKRFSSLEEALESAKKTYIALRESNWEVYEISWFGFKKKKLSLKELYDQGYLDNKISKDFFGEHYNHKR